LYLPTQTAINNYPVNYASCSQIDGNLYIGNDNLNTTITNPRPTLHHHTYLWQPDHSEPEKPDQFGGTE
jgi:hypothetical protein